MIRKVLNWIAKRMKPAAKEMAKVVIVVPSLPCAAPEFPLSVPFRMVTMPDIVATGLRYRMKFHIEIGDTVVCCNMR